MQPDLLPELVDDPELVLGDDWDQGCACDITVFGAQNMKTNDGRHYLRDPLCGKDGRQRSYY